jgi:hypothetical protein
MEPLNPWTCTGCGGSGSLLFMEDAGPLCMGCADLDHLVFLPAGDAALRRCARKASRLAVVVRFSRSRKRYERQGILVEEAALQQAEAQCLADEEARARRREHDRQCRADQDVANERGGTLGPGRSRQARSGPPHAVMPRRLVAMNALTGQRLTALDLDRVRSRYGAPYIVMHRHDLLEVILRHCRKQPSLALETAQELDRVFAAACEAVRVALPSLLRDRRWPMHDRLPASRWSAGRVTLLGDAAHPMLQYLAQGACQAIQDAAALAQELPRLRRLGAWPRQDVQAALRGYEDRRLAQASRVQRAARTWGEIWHVDGLAMALRDEAFRLRAEDDFSRVDWLYGNSAA